MELTSRKRPACVQIRLTVVEDTICTNAGQYYPLEGIFADGTCRDFTLDVDGTITCLRAGEYLLNGASDLAVDKACTITYALYINDALIEETETPHTFTASSKIDNISVTGLLQLNVGDTLVSRAKSDTTNTTITVNTFLVTYYGGL